MTVRKEGKARWVYECQPCGDRVEAVDQFRATEYGQWHEKGPEHAATLIGQAFQALADAFTSIAAPVIEAVSSFAKFFEPPKNLPHDPSLLRDRRKWGGR